jgi:hypothetical protein
MEKQHIIRYQVNYIQIVLGLSLKAFIFYVPLNSRTNHHYTYKNHSERLPETHALVTLREFYVQDISHLQGFFFANPCQDRVCSMSNTAVSP